MYLIAEDILGKTIKANLRNTFSEKLIRAFITFILVDISWLFFRADTVRSGIEMLKKIASDFHFRSFIDGSLLKIGLSAKEINVLIIAIVTLLVVDYLGDKKSIFELYKSQTFLFRYGVFYFLIISLIVFGIYGLGYNAADFIYFQF